MEIHKKLIDVDKDPGWAKYNEENEFVGYTMPGEEGCLAIKSTGILPCTPIEVRGSGRE